MIDVLIPQEKLTVGFDTLQVSIKTRSKIKKLIAEDPYVKRSK